MLAWGLKLCQSFVMNVILKLLDGVFFHDHMLQNTRITTPRTDQKYTTTFQSSPIFFLLLYTFSRPRFLIVLSNYTAFFVAQGL